MNDHTVDLFAQVFQKDSSIVSRQIAGQMLLVPVRQNVGDLESIYLLNKTALVAWNLFDGIVTLAEIRRHITGQFDVDELQAGQDLLELVTNLVSVRALVKV